MADKMAECGHVMMKDFGKFCSGCLMDEDSPTGSDGGTLGRGAHVSGRTGKSTGFEYNNIFRNIQGDC